MTPASLELLLLDEIVDEVKFPVGFWSGSWKALCLWDTFMLLERAMESRILNVEVFVVEP